MTTAPNLTLYGIETQLLELLNFRDAVASDPDMTPAEQKESLEAIDNSIREYVTAEVKKVDGIAHYLREFDARAGVLKQEAKRCADAAKAWEKRGENLESMVISIMQQINATRLDGRTSVLSLRKNPPACEISQPALVPQEYQRVKVTMSVSLLRRIEAALMNEKTAPLFAELQDAKQGEPEPEKDRIKEELKLGQGVPGCRLTQGVRLEVK